MFMRILVNSQQSQDRLKKDLSQIAFHNLYVGKYNLAFFEIDWSQLEDLYKENLKNFS